MAKPMSSDPQDRAGLLLGTIRQVQLWWRLLWDQRVPAWAKLIPLIAVLYILFPLDLVVDPILGLGQLDDLAILVVGMEVFVRMSPAWVVEEIWREIQQGRRRPAADAPRRKGAQTVDGRCRVVEKDAPQPVQGSEVVRAAGD